MINSNRWLTGILIYFFATFNASAALVGFTDRAAWEVAVAGTFSSEDFSSVPDGVYESSPIDVGDFTVSVTGDKFDSIWQNISSTGSGGASINSVNGTQQLNVATGGMGGTTLDFDFEIYAFGADWAHVSDSRTTSFVVGGEQLYISFLTSGGFFGFVSDAALTAIFLSLAEGGADGFGMDNLVYAAATQSVPEPSTIVLLGLGVLGVSVSRFRKT